MSVVIVDEEYICIKMTALAFPNNLSPIQWIEQKYRKEMVCWKGETRISVSDNA